MSPLRRGWGMRPDSKEEQVTFSVTPDPLTRSLILGGALILAGNVLVEVPGWLNAKAT